MKKYAYIVLFVLLASMLSVGCTETSKPAVQASSPQTTPVKEDSLQTTQSSTKMQFSESKKEELIGYVKQYSGSNEVTVTFIPSGNGMLLVDFFVNDVPNKMDLNNNIAYIIIFSRALAEESGIPNTDVSVCAALTNGRGLGIGNYYSSTGKTDIDVSDCHS